MNTQNPPSITRSRSTMPPSSIPASSRRVPQSSRPAPSSRRRLPSSRPIAPARTWRKGARVPASTRGLSLPPTQTTPSAHEVRDLWGDEVFETLVGIVMAIYSRKGGAK